MKLRQAKKIAKKVRMWAYYSHWAYVVSLMGAYSPEQVRKAYWRLKRHAPEVVSGDWILVDGVLIKRRP